MSVYFHANFNLNRENLAGVLGYFIEQPGMNDELIGKQFGYRAPFTKRYKSWLKKCGLIENSTKVKLTKYGEVIYKRDSKLNKESTLKFMHTFLARSENNGEAWSYFYHTFLPKNKSFTKSDLSDALSMKLMSHHPGHFGKNAPMIRVITKVLADSYVSEKAFGPLGIVKLEDGVFLRGNTKITFNPNEL